MLNTLKKIDLNLEKIKNNRPLNKTELNELKKSLWVYFTYNSNAIEWSTITLWETKIILEDWLTIWGKTLKGVSEVQNHKWVLNFLYSFLNSNGEITEDLIKKVHLLILKNIDDENAWVYRKIQVMISWEEKNPTEPNKIKEEMKNLIIWFNENKDNMNPVLLAWEFHYRFVKIHPFIDWNWRTIRILINLILMRKWFPLIIIYSVRRAEYITSLNSKFTQNNFLKFFADIVNENLKDYLRMIDFNN